MAGRMFNRDEYDEEIGPQLGRALLEAAIRCGADFKIETDDGREYALLDDCLTRIAGLVQAVNTYLTKADRQRLNRLRGAIVDISGDDPPMLYDKSEELERAWVYLHYSFGVPLSDDEKYWLGASDRRGSGQCPSA